MPEKEGVWSGSQVNLEGGRRVILWVNSASGDGQVIFVRPRVAADGPPSPNEENTDIYTRLNLSREAMGALWLLLGNRVPWFTEADSFALAG